MLYILFQQTQVMFPIEHDTDSSRVYISTQVFYYVDSPSFVKFTTINRTVSQKMTEVVNGGR